MRWQWLVTGLGIYAIALIATAPATLVDAVLQSTADGKLRLGAAQGTLWSGSGRLELRDAGGRSGVTKTVAWRVLPTSLLRGRIVCEVELDHAAKRFPVTISWSQVEIADADIDLPAAILGLAAPKLAPLELTGEMRFRIANVAVGRSGMRGNAVLQWRSAGSALSMVAPLGDYELAVDGKDAAVGVTLRTLKGPLQLDGKGTWKYGDGPVIAATARVPPQYQEQLAPLLRLIAVERGNGSFELQLK